MDPRSERTRQRCLDAAAQLLDREGLDAVTHLRVATEAGVGRRTIYRHWPDRRSLLHDTLSRTAAPAADPDADLRTGVIAHLRALSRALTVGPLATIVTTLYERGRLDPEFDELRTDLVEAGCAPLRRLLRRAVVAGELPADLDVATAVADLEGPVFYRAILHRRATTAHEITGLVDAVIERPPTRRPARPPAP